MCLFTLVCMIKNTSHLKLYSICARKRATKVRILLGFTGTVSSPAGGSGRLQCGTAAMGTRLSAWARDNFPVLKCHPTTGEVLRCRGSKRAGVDLLVRILWWLELPHMQAQLNPPGQPGFPPHAEPGAASHCCPCRPGREIRASKQRRTAENTSEQKEMKEQQLPDD